MTNKCPLCGREITFRLNKTESMQGGKSMFCPACGWQIWLTPEKAESPIVLILPPPSPSYPGRKGGN